jgi:hypothetical protein
MKKDSKQNRLEPVKNQIITEPRQLDFFVLFDTDREEYSQTVKLWGMIPVHVFGKVEREAGKYLPSFERDFVYDKTGYSIKVTPARIEAADGSDRDAYMGLREQLVEMAILKLAADGRAKVVHMGGLFTVFFTRKNLQDELKVQGHTYSYPQIEEAIKIMFKSSVELRRDGVNGGDSFHPIEAYGFRGQNDEEFTYVKFSPQVTAAIENGDYRLINYKQLMSYSLTLSRMLHKKMVHSFVYADTEEKTFHFLANSVYRDFGLNQDSLLKHKVAEIKKALEELINGKVILSYVTEKKADPTKKSRSIDMKFVVTPHKNFVDAVFKANASEKRRKGQIAIEKNLPSHLRGMLK